MTHDAYPYHPRGLKHNPRKCALHHTRAILKPTLPGNGGVEKLNLSLAGDLNEAAANLFHHLRALDKPGVRGIAVMPIPEEGLGVAINDRLRRAAAPRG